MLHLDHFSDQEFSLYVSELLTATADGGDPLLDSTVTDVLAHLRRRLGLDVVFVGEFVEGQRKVRYVDRADSAPPISAGQGDLLEQTWCQRVADGRLPGLLHDAARLPPGSVPPAPFRIGGFLSTPIRLRSGDVYGTLCCFSQQPRPELREADLQTLKQCAALLARRLEPSPDTGFAATDFAEP